MVVDDDRGGNSQHEGLPACGPVRPDLGKCGRSGECPPILWQGLGINRTRRRRVGNLDEHQAEVGWLEIRVDVNEQLHGGQGRVARGVQDRGPFLIPACTVHLGAGTAEVSRVRGP